MLKVEYEETTKTKHRLLLYESFPLQEGDLLEIGTIIKICNKSEKVLFV